MQIHESENLTILLTDIANFTEHTSAHSREEMHKLLRRHNRLLKATIKYYGGRYVKSTGDGMLTVFRSSTNAVQCAMAIQDTLAEYNYERDDADCLRVRVALHLGEIRWESRKDIMGEAVNLVSRIEEITPPDAVYMSETVYMSMNKAEVPAELVEKHEFKGIVDPVNVYQVPAGQQTRLIATGEPLASSNIPLPYGGMPRPSAKSDPDQLPGAHRGRPVLLASVTAVTSVIALSLVAYWSGWLSPQSEQALETILDPRPLLSLDEKVVEKAASAKPGSAESVPTLLREADNLARAGDIEKLRARAANIPADSAAHPVALVMEGHAEYAAGKRAEALAAYSKALNLNAEARYSEVMAQNLVGSLGYQSTAASKLILEYPTQLLIDYLHKRSGQSGPIGRGHAVRLLQTLGYGNRVDYYGQGLRALEEAGTCEERLEGVQLLRKSGNPDAIPTLEALLGDGIGDWFANRCLRDETRTAIRELRKISANAG